MKFPKCINKKMIIFVVLLSAFLYFSGSFNVMREGYTPPPGTLTVKNMRCDRCISTNQSYQCSDECKKFVSDNNNLQGFAVTPVTLIGDSVPKYCPNLLPF